MVENAEPAGARPWNRPRQIRWAIAALILATPLVAMQLTDEVNWDLADFAIFGGLLAAAGLAYEMATQKTGNTAYKIAVGLAVLAAFLLFWINGAVGIIGNEDNSANLMYFGVLAIGLVGSIVAGFEPARMARAMYVTAAAQALTFVIALAAGWGFTGLITLLFCALWLASARLFAQSSAGAT